MMYTNGGKEMTQRVLDGRLEKGVRAAGGSLPGELCLAASSTAQGQQQLFESIGSSPSHHLSPSHHPLP